MTTPPPTRQSQRTLSTDLQAAIADRYQIERELGAGGMATVYLAYDVRHDRKVAIKVLKPELAAVLGAERFLVEIKTTASLQHPHILPLFDSGTAASPDRTEGTSFLYYVMPFIPGETIREKLNRETQFGIDEAVRITREVADALDYAHRHGVIHRDIKPENILLHDGRAIVMDFGIALAVSAAAGGRMTETGLSLGTPHYMSPEQATAEKDLTRRTDIYSLGVVDRGEDSVDDDTAETARARRREMPDGARCQTARCQTAPNAERREMPEGALKAVAVYAHSGIWRRSASGAVRHLAPFGIWRPSASGALRHLAPSSPAYPDESAVTRRYRNPRRDYWIRPTSCDACGRTGSR